jgi:glycosyltransferase involved in cell wall biosynthesis
MKYVADELVVVDTGSADDSITIAQNGGARVVSYVWQDDFAAARNFALEQVQGDVIIFLDADEYFPEALLKKLRLIISQLNSKPQVAGLCAPRVDIDVENETKVQGALSRLLAGKTVLVIAHRMRTVEAADKIVVLADGKVAEEGSPGELLTKENGIFRRMTQLQIDSAGWSI